MDRNDWLVVIALTMVGAVVPTKLAMRMLEKKATFGGLMVLTITSMCLGIFLATATVTRLMT